MKRNFLLIALLLVFPTLAAAQTQTRERRSSEPEPISTSDSTAVRDRVVGPMRTANHAERQKLVADPKGPDARASTSGANPPSTKTAKQNIAPPGWGNTSVTIKPASDVRISPAKTPGTNNPAIVDRNSGPGKKLVQYTSMVSEVPPGLAPLRTNTNSRVAPTARVPAPTAVYQVGVGDVLDIRLANMPTRESTLYTVLKNGVVEYPLLNGPISVAGMTTDEIARVLSSEIKVIRSARVSVSVRDYASHAVLITGLVDNPGRKTLRREAMPLYAVLAEVLPRPEATVATIVRAGRDQTVLLNNEQAMSTLVLPGDVIRIASATVSAKRFIYVGGDVASPGEREFRDGMTLTQAVLSAGGVSRISKTLVRVARRSASGFLTGTEYDLHSIEDGKSQDPFLQAGDRIEVIRSM